VVDWIYKPFDTLTPRELYGILQARQAVFVVEQTCVYQDADDFDQDARHLMGHGEDGKLVAYLRVLSPDTQFDEPSLGRVITTRAGRGRGLGKALMREGIRRALLEYPGRAIKIGAQRYLDRFYRELGFVTFGEPYVEDGIPHQYMVLAGSSA
jgi:ElaA protein